MAYLTLPKGITRSTGIDPGVPWMGPLPGGGYRGITKRLDDGVQLAAELLAARYRLPIEIRFNSDRLSGGAFLVMRHCAGITSEVWTLDYIRSLIAKHPDWETFDQFCERLELSKTEPEQYVHYCRIAAPLLICPDAANEEATASIPAYLYRRCPSIEAAYDCFAEHYNTH